jgi:hypothetical protein
VQDVEAVGRRRQSVRLDGEQRRDGGRLARRRQRNGTNPLEIALRSRGLDGVGLLVRIEGRLVGSVASRGRGRGVVERLCGVLVGQGLCAFGFSSRNNGVRRLDSCCGRFVVGPGLLTEREAAGDQGDRGDDGGDDGEPPKPSMTACLLLQVKPLGQSFGVSCRQARLEELALDAAEVVAAIGCPGFCRLETTASVQLTLVTFGDDPGSGCVGEMPMDPEAVTVVVQPTPQARPRTEQRLMRDLDRRLAGHGMTVEHEQASGSEGLDDMSRFRFVAQLGDLHATPRVLRNVAERDQPQERTARCQLGRCGHRVERLLGALRQRSGESADLGVGLGSDETRHVGVEQLGQCVLQQGERARLVAHIGDDPGHETRFVRGSLTTHWLDDRSLEFVGGEGGNADSR